jgi:beta-glucosidase-like glycosyl hydrolase
MIMCVFSGRYNAVNGVPSCANDWLLGTVLRQTWQFYGYVTSGGARVVFDYCCCCCGFNKA